MFAKNKISQSMIDAVNSIIDEKKENVEVQQLNEAGTGHVIIPTATGTKVYGNSGYGSAKAHRDQTQHSLDTEKGPSEKQLTGKDPDLKYKKNPPSTSKNYNKFGAHMSKIDQKGHEVSGHYEKNEEVEVDEELKGNQHKIDKNKNNKIDAGDFELLRKKKVKESYFVSRLLDHAVFAEEVELELNEVLSKDADAGDWIHDFIHSDNPKFAGKTKAERKKMALGAYYSKKNEEHDDEKDDKELVKKMVKKNALKENNSAMATGAITTDTLAGRVDGGKSDSFKSFKLRVNPVDKEGDGSVRTPDCEEPEETSARSSIKARGGEVEVKGGNEKYKDFHKEEIEQAEALVKNFSIINEVSVGAKIRAYAQHTTDSFEHGDMGNDDESEHHHERASKIMAHIEKHHGPEAAKHAEKLANSMIFGRHDIGSKTSPGEDSLHGGLRRNLNKSVTKSGKIGKSTQKAMKGSYMAKRTITGPKANLPEEVESLDEKEGTGGSDPLANRQDYAKRHGTGQVYKKTHPGDKTGMTKSFAYDIKRSGPKGKLPEQVSEELVDFNIDPLTGKMRDEVEILTSGYDKKLKPTDVMMLEEGTSPKKGDDAMAGKQNLSPAKKSAAGTVKSDMKNFGRWLAGKKETNEEVESLDEDRYLMKYLLSRGINPEYVDRNTKVGHAKSNEFKKWKSDHLNSKQVTGESVEVPFEGPYTKTKKNVKDKSGAIHTPMSRARDLARSALKSVQDKTKIKN